MLARIVLLICAITSLSFSRAEAQQRTRLPRIGVLLPSPTGVKTYLLSFRQSLNELGYVEGQNVLIEYRIAEPNSSRGAGIRISSMRFFPQQPNPRRV
jgi:putative ABC transport system substrate-binding protein